MKPIIKSIFMAIAAMAVVSCADNDNEGSFVVNGGAKEVSINRLGGNVKIPIQVSGDWTATITNNERNGLLWSDVRQVKGNGPGTLTVDVDYLNPSLQIPERKALVTLKSGDQSQVITLRQFIGLEDGEKVPNSTEYYSDLWYNKGVGKGFYPDTTRVCPNDVLNIKNVIEMAETPDYSTLFAQEDRPGMTVDATINDTLSNNLDSIGVHCVINVKYANFKLSIAADYHNAGKQIENAKTYTASQDLEYKVASTSAADIEAILEDAWDDTTNTWKKDSLARKVLSVGFFPKWANVMKNRDDETMFHRAIDNILENFGPVFIDGATLGGSVFTAIQYDSLGVYDNFEINGTLTTEIALAAIKISGEVNVDYAKNGQDVWENSHYLCNVSGGGPESYAALLEQLNSMKPQPDEIKDAAQKWMQSIVSSTDESDNTAVINIQCIGIWNLFPFDVVDSMKEYIMQKYAGKKLCFDLNSMGVTSIQKIQ